MIVECPGTPRFDGCAAWRERIELLFDHALPPKAAGAVERHVASCPHCRAYEAALEEIRHGLRDLPGVSADTPPMDVLEAVWAVTIGDGARTGARLCDERRVGAGISERGGAEPRGAEPRGAEPRLTGPFPAPVRRASVWAAAAVLALAASAAFVLHRGPDPDATAYTEVDLAQLDRDLQTALVTIGRTLHSTEQFAVNEVLIGETAPALRQLPLSPENQ